MPSRRGFSTRDGTSGGEGGAIGNVRHVRKHRKACQYRPAIRSDKQVDAPTNEDRGNVAGSGRRADFRASSPSLSPGRPRNSRMPTTKSDAGYHLRGKNVHRVTPLPSISNRFIVTPEGGQQTDMNGVRKKRPSMPTGTVAIAYRTDAPSPIPAHQKAHGTQNRCRARTFREIPPGFSAGEVPSEKESQARESRRKRPGCPRLAVAYQRYYCQKYQAEHL